MALLGESLAAAALVAASLKFKGTLTLQLAGQQRRGDHAGGAGHG